MSSLTIVRKIAAPVDTVFGVITTPEGIAQWWGPDDGPVLQAEFEPRVGGRFFVRFQMLDGTQHECSGKVLEYVRPVRLVTTWRWHGNEGEGESRVEIALKPAGAGCELVFTHALLPDDPATVQGHERGWTGSLDKLERHLKALQDPADKGLNARPPT